MWYFAISVCAAIVLLGVWLMHKSSRDLVRAKQSVNWPTAKGRITRCGIASDTSGEGGGYEPDIEFTYSVDGRDYTSGYVRIGMLFSGTRKFASSMVARYSVGQGVVVAYDPERPAFAILEPGNRAEALKAFMFGFAFALMGICVPLIVWLMWP